MQNLKHIKTKLSKWTDSLTSQLKGDPIVFKIEKANQYLYYFGSIHSFDPKHQQFSQLKKLFEEFKSKTKKEESVIMVEGGLRPMGKSETESILTQGEAGFISFFGTKDGYKIISPEPKRIDEMADLDKVFSKDEIQYYYFARVVHQWNRRNPKPPFEEYVGRFLEMDKYESGWSDFDFSLENMKKIHHKIFNTEFDQNNAQFFYDAINPTVLNYVTNKYSRDMGINRDAFIVKSIIDEWGKKKNIFVVYGCGHALTQKKALEELL